MHIHILGICGTFMGGVAALARAAGHTVTGSDLNVYPPMSEQLEAMGIEIRHGYEPDHLQPAPDCVVVGNVVGRGNPAVEYMLDAGLAYQSGPAWLADNVLRGRPVVAVAGTHGKTTTSSMLAFILDRAGLRPGFLIGGMPLDFGCSARLADGGPFVVEADEYDTAFFDKRAKMIHYAPKIAVINNIEFDHADIYPDLEAIKRQFHHFVRVVPRSGRLLVNAADEVIGQVLAMGCWTPVETFGGEDGEWQAGLRVADASAFAVTHHGRPVGEVRWGLLGTHNLSNALAATAAASAMGVPPARAVAALSEFRGVRRRLERRGEAGGVTIYDDFAHHPTAIATTLAGLRSKVGAERIVVLLELRSNSMRLGAHRRALAGALAGADRIMILAPGDMAWNPAEVAAELGDRAALFADPEALLAAALAALRPGDHALVMSNGAFGGIHDRLLEALGAGP